MLQRRVIRRAFFSEARFVIYVSVFRRGRLVEERACALAVSARDSRGGCRNRVAPPGSLGRGHGETRALGRLSGRSEPHAVPAVCGWCSAEIAEMLPREWSHVPTSIIGSPLSSDAHLHGSRHMQVSESGAWQQAWSG